MSVIQMSDSPMERFSDWMNPILVKETRQALKSRAFVATFMLLLIASWLICMFGVAFAGMSLEYGTPSRSFFQAFFFVLCAAVLVIVPFGAFRSLLTEQDSQTYELLSITSLTPRQIVLGKLSNSVVQILVYYSAIAPFIAFTSLLQGFDLFGTSVLLLVLLGVSILLCTFTLMLSTVGRNRQVQTLSSLFIVGGLVMAFSSMMGFSFAMLQGEMTAEPEFFAALICFLLVGVSYFFLFLQITISQLMYESGNKSTGVRLVATAQMFLVWAVTVGFAWFAGTTIDDDTFYVIVTLTLIHWGIFGFFITMERDYLSRRIRRDLPQRGILRLFLVPFMPGGTRGLILVLLNLLILMGIMLVVQPFVSRVNAEFLQVSFAVVAYMVIYMCMGSMISRKLLKISNELKPMHARTLLIIIFAIASIMPHMILSAMDYYDNYNPPYSLLQITDPISTITTIGNGAYAGGAVGILMIAAIVAIALNVPAMIRSVMEILAPDRPQRKPVEPPASEVLTAAT